MNASSLDRKTVRPGSLTGYSYYHSNRQPGAGAAPHPAYIAASRSRLIPWRKALILVAVVAAAAWGWSLLHSGSAVSTKSSAAAAQKTTLPTPATTAPVVAAPATDICKGNTLDKFIKVSISQRHLWACQGSKTVYDSPVITGMLAHASTLTPIGTYHIYGKTTDTTLTGSDETGSWSDPVSYWMPFLNNQYGTYGFHDATWRAADAFGTIDPNSADASHGCVELPLATSAWLYNWAVVGTTLTIAS